MTLFPEVQHKAQQELDRVTRTELQENLSKFLDAFPVELEMEKVPTNGGENGSEMVVFRARAARTTPFT
jgi:hypothetical protein